MVKMFLRCLVIWRIFRALPLPGGAPKLPLCMMLSALASSPWEGAGVLRDCLRERLGLGSDSVLSSHLSFSRILSSLNLMTFI